jgi:hypothetical protein
MVHQLAQAALIDAPSGSPLPEMSTGVEPLASTPGADDNSNQPVFFPVSKLKFIVMNVATFGLYEIFWAFKSWKYLADTGKKKISPEWRAWFSIIFLYDLLKEMRDHAKSTKGPFSVSFSPIDVFLPWLILTVLARLPDLLGLIGMLAFIPLLSVVGYINEMNQMEGKGHLINSKFSTINKVGIGIGAVLLLLTIIGSFLPNTH